MHHPADFHGKTGSRTDLRSRWARNRAERFSVGRDFGKPEPGGEHRRVRRRHGVFGSRSGRKSDRSGRSLRPSAGRAATGSNGIERPHRPAARSCDVTADLELPHYVRFVVRDRPGILAALAGVFSRHHINVDAVLQRPGYMQVKAAVRDHVGAVPARAGCKRHLPRSADLISWSRLR